MFPLKELPTFACFFSLPSLEGKSVQQYCRLNCWHFYSTCEVNRKLLVYRLASQNLCRHLLVTVEKHSLVFFILLIVVSFLLSIPVPHWETQLFIRRVKVQIRKSNLIILTIKGKNSISGGKKTIFSSIPSFICSVFSFFWRKKYALDLSEKGHQSFSPSTMQCLLA